jgi:protocatechuate 3,4-dioxygenase alpha subunit
MMLPTPSQTVGPFFHIGLPYEGGERLVSEGGIRLGGIVYDGDGPVDDALVEIWQANPEGRYDHPEDQREEVPLTDGFRGFGRCATGDDGRYEFLTVKPGPVLPQAPHIEVAVFARGLLKQVVTRIYFPDEAEANESDPILSLVDPDRREGLVARAEDGALRFDVHLQGERVTPFFDV